MHTVAEKRFLGAAKAGKDRFEDGAVIQRNVGTLPNWHPRGDNKGRHTKAIRYRDVRFERSRRSWHRQGVGNRWDDMIIEAAMFVIGDDEQRLLPQRLLGTQRIINP